MAWSASRNLPTDDPELAATFMRATAAQSDRVQKPVYHIALSFDLTDAVDRATMERVADRVLERLGLAEYQAVVAAHQDRAHPHVHLFVNRVHPETGRAWERWHDQPVIQQVLREEERALGLRAVPGRLAAVRDSVGELTVAANPTLQRRSVAGRASSDEISVPPWAPAVEALVRDLRTLERVRGLTAEQFAAQLEASAARGRVTHLDAAAARFCAADDALGQSFARVYRDAASAHRAYLGVVDTDGAARATQVLRERPERYGDLVKAEQPRGLGFGRRADDRAARAAVPIAVVRAAELAEASRRFGAAAAEFRARRLEAAFTRELAGLYADPPPPVRLSSALPPPTAQSTRQPAYARSRPTSPRFEHPRSATRRLYYRRRFVRRTPAWRLPRHGPPRTGSRQPGPKSSARIVCSPPNRWPRAAIPTARRCASAPLAVNSAPYQLWPN